MKYCNDKCEYFDTCNYYNYGDYCVYDDNEDNEIEIIVEYSTDNSAADR